MPELERHLDDEDLRRAPPISKVDLAPYLHLLDEARAEGKRGSMIRLLENEQPRTEKRRFTAAAKELGLKLTWRKAPEGRLKYVLSGEGEPVPGARKRDPNKPRKPRAPRAKQEETAES
jgi:hypothetical protein